MSIDDSDNVIEQSYIFFRKIGNGWLFSLFIDVITRFVQSQKMIPDFLEQ